MGEQGTLALERLCHPPGAAQHRGWDIHHSLPPQEPHPRMGYLLWHKLLFPGVSGLEEVNGESAPA